MSASFAARSVLAGALLILGLPAPASTQDDSAGERGEHAEQATGLDASAHDYGHALSEDVGLSLEEDPAAGVMTVLLGPLDLPARGDHHQVAQSPDKILEIPFDGWLLAYTPRLLDGEGRPVPGRLLHHVGFWHTGRSDFLCPNKQEHVFGAGGEMNEWVPLPGFGYKVGRGERLRMNTMFHNPTADDYPDVWLQVTVRYRSEPAAGSEGSDALTDVYPAWFDVQECGPSAYDLPVGESLTVGRFEIPVDGILLGVGGHLHDYGRELVLYDETRDREVARLPSRLDERGHIQSMPVVPFVAHGGYWLEAGDVVRVEARYDNPTGGLLEDGAMGIVVGYFVPDDEAAMEAFRR